MYDGQVVGLGTGSTASWVVRLLGDRVRDGLRIRAIPTSIRTRALAESVGISLVTLADEPSIDVTIDGADEVDGAGNLIKGGGGACFARRSRVGVAPARHRRRLEQACRDARRVSATD